MRLGLRPGRETLPGCLLGEGVGSTPIALYPCLPSSPLVVGGCREVRSKGVRGGRGGMIKLGESPCSLLQGFLVLWRDKVVHDLPNEELMGMAPSDTPLGSCGGASR